MASKCTSRSRGPSGSGYGPRVDITERFASVVQQPDADVALDEAAFLIAAHDHAVDVDAGLRDLDALAAEVGTVDAPALAHALFVTQASPATRSTTAIRATRTSTSCWSVGSACRSRLSVLMIEIGRRLGLELCGVGMPGHFLVGANGSYIDPFHQGAHLTADDARTLYERTHPGAAFVDAYLDPVGPRAVLARMLANLVHSFGTRAPLAAVWALKLRLAIPDLPDHERDDGERLLARLKAYSN